MTTTTTTSPPTATTTTTPFSEQFPTVQEALEYARLSKIIYKVDSIDDQEGLDSIPTKYPIECHFFGENSEDMEVMIVSCGGRDEIHNQEEDGYIAVVYRGTESTYDKFVDARVTRKLFAPPDVPSSPKPLPSCSVGNNDPSNDDNIAATATTDSKDSSLESNKGLILASSSNMDQYHMGNLLTDDCYVHSGFNNSFFADNLHIQMSMALDKVMKQKPHYRKIVFTGHSLGAAVSTLGAIYTAARLPNNNILCMTYGCPRIGNDAFQQCIQRNVRNCAIWRCVLDDDIITRIPPASLGYVDLGHTIHFDRITGGVAYYNHTGDIHRGYASPNPKSWDLFPDSGWYQSIVDHKCTQYITYLGLALTTPKYFPTEFVKIIETVDDNGKDGVEESRPEKSLFGLVEIVLQRFKVVPSNTAEIAFVATALLLSYYYGGLYWRENSRQYKTE